MLLNLYLQLIYTKVDQLKLQMEKTRKRSFTQYEAI